MSRWFVEFVITLVVVSLSPPLKADDWPRFRGENGNGASSDTGLPMTWSGTENLVWRTSLPGYGASSPVTYGSKIFLTGYSKYGTKNSISANQKNLKLHVICLDRAGGDLLWEKSIPANQDEYPYQAYVNRHGYATPTLTVDANGVYAFFGSSGVVSYDHQGILLWKTNVGLKTHEYGSAASPVLYEEYLILNASVESDSLIALNKKTGAEAWRTPDLGRCWNTPIIVDVPDKEPELVLNASGTLVAFSPQTGQRLWNFNSGTTVYMVPSVVMEEGVVYAVCGRTGTVVAVRAGGRGDVTKSREVWKSKGTSDVPSPSLYEGYLFFISDTGIANCLDAMTGEVIYKQRLRETGQVFASVLAADGKLYCVTREKGTFVLAARPDFKQLAHNVIEDDTSIFNASPIVSRRQLLLRSDRYLYCIGK